MATLVLFPFVYVVQYTVSLAGVAVWVQALGQDPAWAPLAGIVVAVPVTYLLGRRIFRG
jgi:GtrA-like protein.